MTRTRPFPFDSVPDEIVEATAADLAPYSVAIVVLEGSKPQLLGSGTLVTHAGIHGVLTARHVVEALQRYAAIDLVMSRSRHRFTLEVKLLHFIVSPSGRTEESGPDLALIQVPEVRVAMLQAMKSFANLDTHRGKLGAVDKWGPGMSCLIGFPEEFVRIHPAEHGFTMEAYGQSGVGAGAVEYEADGTFDYCWTPVSYLPTNNPPRSYGGVCGGGLWQCVLAEHDGRVVVTDYILRGVAFYQSALRGDTRRIKCHAGNSIYSWLASRMQAGTDL
jgi:hypothetical protein